MNRDRLLAALRNNWPVALFAVLTVHFAFLVILHAQDGAEAFFADDTGFLTSLALAPVRSMGPAATYVLLLALISLCVSTWMGREIDNLPRRAVGLPLLLLGISGVAATSAGRSSSGLLGSSLEWGFAEFAGSASAAVICGAIFAYGLLLARDWFFFDRIRAWITDPSEPALATPGGLVGPSMDDDVRPLQHEVPLVDLSDVDEADVKPIRPRARELAAPAVLDGPDDDLLLARLSSEVAAPGRSQDVVTDEVEIVGLEDDPDDDIALESEDEVLEFASELGVAEEEGTEFEIMTLQPPLGFIDEDDEDDGEEEGDRGDVDADWETVEVDLDVPPTAGGQVEEAEAVLLEPADELSGEEDDDAETMLEAEVEEAEDELEEAAAFGVEDGDDEDEGDYVYDDDVDYEDDDDEEEEDDEEDDADPDFDNDDDDEEEEEEGAFGNELIASYAEDVEEDAETTEPAETQLLFGEVMDDELEDVEIVAEEETGPEEYEEETIELEYEEEDVEEEAEAEPTLLDYGERATALETAPAATAPAGLGDDDWAAWDDAPPLSAAAMVTPEPAEEPVVAEPPAGRGEANEDDEAFRRAVAVCVEEGRCSVSILQRSLGMTFPAASASIERMEEQGIVGPYRGSGVREILSVPEGHAAEEA